MIQYSICVVLVEASKASKGTFCLNIIEIVPRMYAGTDVSKN